MSQSQELPGEQLNPNDPGAGSQTGRITCSPRTDRRIRNPCTPCTHRTPRKPPKSCDRNKPHTPQEIAQQILWVLICVFTLGFPAKYRERLRLFESLHDLDNDTKPWSKPPTYSDRGYKANSLKSMRQKQQEEWDRLNIAVSVITATSAAALAIQAISDALQVYWLVTAFYSIAFGLSLEGIILITYMTISAGGASDEAIARIARGKLVPGYTAVKPSAFMMALPAIFATYSSIALLVGLGAMVLAGPGEGVDTQATEYILVTIIPVGVGLLFLCMAVVFCEIGTWIEIFGRRGSKTTYPVPDEDDDGDDDNQLDHCYICCSAAAAAQSCSASSSGVSGNSSRKF